MINILESVKSYKIPNKTENKLNERQELLKQIDLLYRSPFEKSGRVKKGIPELSTKRLCMKLAHIPTKDLSFLVSMGKDMHNRNQSFAGYLLYSIKPQ